MEYGSPESSKGIFYFILILIIISIAVFFAWKYNSFNIRERFDENYDKALDKLDNRPRQIITAEPPKGKEFCIQNEFTNVVGYDMINECCLYEWRGNGNVVATCITSQINGETKYNTFNNNYVDDYRSYLSEVQ